MEWMLIGSAAMRYHFSDAREAKDIDILSPRDFVGMDCFWHPDLEDFVYNSPNWVATPDELYTIKISHAFWGLHGTWRKHMNDSAFLQEHGAKFLPDLYETLYSICEEIHGPKKAKLNMEAEDFFTDRIERVYDHDSLHRSVAYYDRPLYERILKDGSTVAVDKAKFDALSYPDKLSLVREEVYATALERRIIPSNYTDSPGAAYNWALQNTVTSLSKGWFALFVALNYPNLRIVADDYVTRHQDNADRLIKLEEE